MTLPKHYLWLQSVDPLPKMVKAALDLYGTEEFVSSKNNPLIMQWAKDCKVPGYNADSIPWCGLFMAKVATVAQKPVPASPLWALNWARFGEEGGQPELGDTLVFVRPGGGHVGLYIGEDEACYHVLGGNQGDRVSITRIGRERLYAVRQPKYVNKPATAIRRQLSPVGAVSKDEH